MSLIEKPIVLSLNASWQAIGFLTPKQALVAMCGGVYGSKPPALALDLEIAEDGSLTYANPVDWETWLKLPVREADLSLSTARGAIRCPSVVIRPAFNQMPVKARKLSRRAILERDGFRCQYSGRQLPEKDLNLDHIIPRSKGGRSTWDNLVTSDKKINLKKGSKSNEEAGLVLTRKPFAPKALPVSYGIEPKHPHHRPFLSK